MRKQQQRLFHGSSQKHAREGKEKREMGGGGGGEGKKQKTKKKKRRSWFTREPRNEMSFRGKGEGGGGRECSSFYVQ